MATKLEKKNMTENYNSGQLARLKDRVTIWILKNPAHAQFIPSIMNELDTAYHMGREHEYLMTRMGR